MSQSVDTGLRLACVALLVAVGLIIVESIVFEYGLTGVAEFSLVYAWLAIFVWASTKMPSKRRSLLIAGALPLAIVAVGLTILSFPTHLLPLFIMMMAIAKSSNRRLA